MHLIKCLLAVFAMVFATGCSSVPLVQLRHEGPSPLEPAHKKGVKVHLLPAKNNAGYAQGPGGYILPRRGDVEITVAQEPAEWVVQTLQKELEGAGYRVSRGSRPNPDADVNVATDLKLFDIVGVYHEIDGGVSDPTSLDIRAKVEVEFTITPDSSTESSVASGRGEFISKGVSYSDATTPSRSMSSALNAALKSAGPELQRAIEGEKLPGKAK